jgi:spore coat protein JC
MPIMYKLMKDATPEQIKEARLEEHYVEHNAAVNPFTVTYIQSKGNPIPDLYEDIVLTSG